MDKPYLITNICLTSNHFTCNVGSGKLSIILLDDDNDKYKLLFEIDNKYMD
jgi:hypothetical protein